MTTNTTVDWSVLIKALIILALTIILSIAMIWGNLQYQDYTKNWAKTQQTQLNQLEKEHWNLDSALQIVNNRYLIDYSQLKQEGFFTNKPHLTIGEQRYKLEQEIEKTHLSFLKKNHKLFNYKYELFDKPYVISHIPTVSSFKAYQIQTHLELELFHEGNFMTFINRLTKIWKFPSLFHLKSCKVKRLRKFTNPQDISKPYFQANCILIWYTAQIKNDQ